MVSDSIFIREIYVSLYLQSVRGCERVVGASAIAMCGRGVQEKHMVISTAPLEPIRNDRNTDFAPSIFRPSAPAK